MLTSQVETQLHFNSFGHWVTISRLTLLQIRFGPTNVCCKLMGKKKTYGKKCRIVYKRLWPFIKSRGTQSYVVLIFLVGPGWMVMLHGYLAEGMWDSSFSLWLVFRARQLSFYHRLWEFLSLVLWTVLTMADECGWFCLWENSSFFRGRTINCRPYSKEHELGLTCRLSHSGGMVHRPRTTLAFLWAQV